MSFLTKQTILELLWILILGMFVFYLILQDANKRFYSPKPSTSLEEVVGRVTRPQTFRDWFGRV